MSEGQLLVPVLVQVFLTVVVMVMMGRARARSLAQSRRSLEDRDVANGTFEWSEAALLAANNFKNQFEVPVLFYAAVLFALHFKQTDVVMAGFAWVFVISRVLHAGVHLSTNVVLWRGSFYLIGVAAVAAMWVLIATSVLMGGA